MYRFFHSFATFREILGLISGNLGERDEAPGLVSSIISAQSIIINSESITNNAVQVHMLMCFMKVRDHIKPIQWTACFLLIPNEIFLGYTIHHSLICFFKHLLYSRLLSVGHAAMRMVWGLPSKILNQ